MRGAVITLLTDFGTKDGYVGEMTGALLSRAPMAHVVDIAHDIPPQDIDAARLALARYWRSFPEGSVHLAVVDPGVGTERRALAVECAGRFLVGPDNGILSAALDSGSATVVSLVIPAGASATFHGRDLFAPVAASLALGATISTFGPPVANPVIRRTPEPRRDGERWVGEVIAIDRFGNAITNIQASGRQVTVGTSRLRVCRTYGDLGPGLAGALLGSNGLLEIAVRDGNAATQLGLERGARVELE